MLCGVCCVLCAVCCVLCAVCCVLCVVVYHRSAAGERRSCNGSKGTMAKVCALTCTVVALFPCLHAHFLLTFYSCVRTRCCYIILCICTVTPRLRCSHSSTSSASSFASSFHHSHHHSMIHIITIVSIIIQHITDNTFNASQSIHLMHHTHHI